MAEETVRRRVEEMLERSGFPLEIEFSSFLEERGWSVAPSMFHLDLDLGIPREIDMIAWRTCAEASGQYELRLNLIIECKTSQEIHWVFYTRPRKKDFEFYQLSYPKGLLYTDFIESARLRSLAPARIPALAIRYEQQFGPLTGVLPPQVARRLTDAYQMRIADADNLRCLSAGVKSVHNEEAPKTNRPKDLSIYEVARDLWKATWDEMMVAKTVINGMFESISRGARLSNEAKWPIQLFLPIVIFDGSMWNWIGKEKRLDKIDEVILQVPFLSQNYPSPSALICVAKKDRAFPLIIEIEEDLNKIANLLASNLTALDAQRDVIEEGIRPQNI
jgi:hypothetical protein